MKIYNALLAIVIALTFFGCEEVIDVDLNTAEPRLVVDAAIKWQKGTDGSQQIIKLTTTAAYFSNSVPVVSGATVFVTDEAGNNFQFVEDQQTSDYICSNFIPLLNQSYTLTVIYENQTYTATELLRAVPAIDSIEQQPDGGFSGEDTELKIFFTDNGATTDYYLFAIRPQSRPLYQVLDDNFIQGNQSFGLFNIEDLDSGTEVDIEFSAISQQYYNYLSILLSIAGEASGSPFQSPPVTVRGNVVNQTDASNFALGYFSLSETDAQQIVID